jgi:membrane fusion protein, adhesin transport system
MLNISHNSINSKLKGKNISSLKRVESKISKKVVINLFKWGILLLFTVSLLPWTQNVRTSGSISTLHPNQRPQEIQSVISGRIESWKVKEGDLVKKGDTIAIISEIKDQYFDKNLLNRTANQIDFKKQSIESYIGKIQSQGNQLKALIDSRENETKKILVKMEQTKLKVQNDSIKYYAAQLDNSISLYQYQRMDSLYRKGLKSLADLETRKMKAQQSNAKEVEAKNSWQISKKELANLKNELNLINTKFESEYAKTSSDKFSTESDKFDLESNISKMENQYSNYQVRKSFHIIQAPQDGYVMKLYVQGIQETVKEGKALLSFMPLDYDLTVEVYVAPIDLPLMNIGEHVRLQFDGWPAIVFNGWPGASYGTYGGQIYAIDQFISKNGKYRILIKPEEKDHPWPKEIRVGGGVKAFILLNDVPIVYELWRNINGFPADFYQPTPKK